MTAIQPEGRLLDRLRSRWREIWSHRPRWRTVWDRGPVSFLPMLFAETAPLDLRLVGRTLLRAALVGVAAGLAGAAFFAGLEYLQAFALEYLIGYEPLRAEGETFVNGLIQQPVFRPWLLLIMPAIGGLACGLISRLAPETRGGGADAMIDAFHHQSGVIRPRVIWVKALASAATLGSGGVGGREGPTMQIGGALGSTVGALLRVSAREQRILLVAGVAAGIAAVFRTPLGAALIAVEVLYRDGFESDGLIPSVLASVVAYSVVTAIFGESTLFAHAARFPFEPSHLPLYGVLALVLAALSILFLASFRVVRRWSGRLPGPEWLRPAVGGLALGILCTPIIMGVGSAIGRPGQGLGILGGGYGAVQMAITGSSWLPGGWNGVALLTLLALAKLFTTTLTIGTGGSAGDFAPSLAIGGLLGGAFGRACQLWVDPSIDPGAFALVGMGCFYGGVAHVPLSALVLVCELAGNYDLLVPLMLALGISFVAQRGRTLYHAQVPTQRDSPVHRDALLLDVLRTVRVGELMARGRPFVSFSPATPAEDMLRRIGDAAWQDVFPVVEPDGSLSGLVSADALRILAAEQSDTAWAVAADVMQPAVTVSPEDDLHVATEKLVQNGLRELPVIGRKGEILGFLDEAEVARVYLRSASRAEDAASSRRDLPRAGGAGGDGGDADPPAGPTGAA
ncbi:MAG TPA: chloride channel protein [Kofleriaceae bacterium]|nr:chloride channel protein [Kofleriaceae bacterium]